MSPMRLIILLVAAGAAIGAALLVRGMSGPSSPVAAPGEPVVIEKEVEVSSTQVLVARMDMRVGSLLTPDDFEWSDWPEKAVNAGYFTQERNPDAIEELSGSVVKVALIQGEPIIGSKIVKKGETGFMAALLEPGLRAISVEISPALRLGSHPPHRCVLQSMSPRRSLVPSLAPGETARSMAAADRVQRSKRRAANISLPRIGRPVWVSRTWR